MNVYASLCASLANVPTSTQMMFFSTCISGVCWVRPSLWSLHLFFPLSIPCLSLLSPCSPATQFNTCYTSITTVIHFRDCAQWLCTIQLRPNKKWCWIRHLNAAINLASIIEVCLDNTKVLATKFLGSLPTTLNYAYFLASNGTKRFENECAYCETSQLLCIRTCNSTQAASARARLSVS